MRYSHTRKLLGKHRQEPASDLLSLRENLDAHRLRILLFLVIRLLVIKASSPPVCVHSVPSHVGCARLLCEEERVDETAVCVLERGTHLWRAGVATLDQRRGSNAIETESPREIGRAER